MCSTAEEVCPLRQSFEDSRNSLALYIELIGSGIPFSDRARAGLIEIGEMQLRQLDATARDQLIEGSAPS